MANECVLPLTGQIGMPLDTEKIRFLCLLDQFLTGNSLVVTPQVMIIVSQEKYWLTTSVWSCSLPTTPSTSQR